MQQYLKSIGSVDLKPLADQFGKLTASVEGLKDVNINVNNDGLNTAKKQMDDIKADADAVNAALKDLDVDINAQIGLNKGNGGQGSSLDAAAVGAGNLENLVKILPEATKGVDKLGLAFVGLGGTVEKESKKTLDTPSKLMVRADESFN